MSLPHAVIIAGGKGQRLGGVRKADLRIGGSRLIDRVTSRLGKVAEPLVISTGADGLRFVLPQNAVAVPDLDIGCAGPLAGLVAAAVALENQGVHAGIIVSVAVDTPFLPTDFVARMMDGLGDASGAYAAWGEDFYPPNAVWRVEGLAERLMSKSAPTSLKALQIEIGARRVDWFVPDQPNPFANLNTLEDLVSLGTRALP